MAVDHPFDEHRLAQQHLDHGHALLDDGDDQRMDHVDRVGARAQPLEGSGGQQAGEWPTFEREYSLRPRFAPFPAPFTIFPPGLRRFQRIISPVLWRHPNKVALYLTGGLTDSSRNCSDSTSKA